MIEQRSDSSSHDTSPAQPPAYTAATAPSPSLRETRDAIMSQVHTIPVFPAIASQILHLVNNEEASIEEIVRLAEHDPGLTSNVLRIANSAYFAGIHAIGSLREAVIRLGTKRLSELVLMSVTAPLAGQPILGYGLASGQLLEHSITVAVGVESLAEETGTAQAPDHGFTAGLLHDVGKIVLGTFVGVDADRILRVAFDGGCSFEEAERQILGITHPEVGALLLQHWNLPPALVEAVQFHHAPDTAPQQSVMVDWVHMADQLALESGIGAGIDGLQYRASTSVAARIGLDRTAAERIVCKMVDRLRTFNELVQQCSGDDDHGA